jgi:hypothetical protein
MTAPHINQLREQLLATLADLRNRENPMEPDRARAVAQVASVLVDTAKVEVDYLKATGQRPRRVPGRAATDRKRCKHFRRARRGQKWNRDDHAPPAQRLRRLK